MVFSSIFFIFIFLPVTLALYYLVPVKLRDVVLLLMSLVFYAWGEPVYVILMVLSIMFNYVMGLQIDLRQEMGNADRARFFLIAAVAVDLGLLGIFKYYGFIVENLNHIPFINIPEHQLGLPIGISFYTFQTLSYIIDVYRKKIKAQRSILLLGVYITMFPQLIAGPIVQYGDIERQLYDRNISREHFAEGVRIFIKGLAKKVLLANEAGRVFDILSGGSTDELSVLSAWMIAVAFTFQIYFDFSGYSDMAIGLGKMLGFDFKINFDHPYMSTSATEFWRRWHISLGSWFRDYVYIPLGGSFCPPKRHIFNMMVVWMLTGLWHGASWNFVFWGLYYGILLTFEKYVLFKNPERHYPSVLLHVYAMLAAMIGWVFFAVTDMSKAFRIIGIMFGGGAHPLTDNAGLYYLMSMSLLWAVMIIASTDTFSMLEKKLEERNTRPAVYVTAAFYSLLLLASLADLVNDTYNPFLYFRF